MLRLRVGRRGFWSSFRESRVLRELGLGVIAVWIFRAVIRGKVGVCRNWISAALV
jgi:hypothetical protein